MKFAYFPNVYPLWDIQPFFLPTAVLWLKWKRFDNPPLTLNRTGKPSKTSVLFWVWVVTVSFLARAPQVRHLNWCTAIVLGTVFFVNWRVIMIFQTEKYRTAYGQCRNDIGNGWILASSPFLKRLTIFAICPWTIVNTSVNKVYVNAQHPITPVQCMSGTGFLLSILVTASSNPSSISSVWLRMCSSICTSTAPASSRSITWRLIVLLPMRRRSALVVFQTHGNIAQCVAVWLDLARSTRWFFKHDSELTRCLACLSPLEVLKVTRTTTIFHCGCIPTMKNLSRMLSNVYLHYKCYLHEDVFCSVQTVHFPRWVVRHSIDVYANESSSD